MRNFAKFAAMGVLAAAVCGGAVVSVVSNKEKEIKKTVKTAEKSKSLYAVKENGGSRGGCCSSAKTSCNGVSSNSVEKRQQEQGYSGYDCH